MGLGMKTSGWSIMTRCPRGRPRTPWNTWKALATLTVSSQSSGRTTTSSAKGIRIVNLGIHLNSHAGATPSDSQSTSSRWSLTAAWHRSTHSAIPGEFSIKEIPWSSGTSWIRLGQKSHRTQRAWSRISRPFFLSLESCMKMKAASSQIWLSAVAAATCLKNMPGRRGRAT